MKWFNLSQFLSMQDCFTCRKWSSGFLSLGAETGPEPGAILAIILQKRNAQETLGRKHSLKEATYLLIDMNAVQEKSELIDSVFNFLLPIQTHLFYWPKPYFTQYNYLLKCINLSFIFKTMSPLYEVLRQLTLGQLFLKKFFLKDCFIFSWKSNFQREGSLFQKEKKKNKNKINKALKTIRKAVFSQHVSFFRTLRYKHTRVLPKVHESGLKWCIFWEIT